MNNFTDSFQISLENAVFLFAYTFEYRFYTIKHREKILHQFESSFGRLIDELPKREEYKFKKGVLIDPTTGKKIPIERVNFQIHQEIPQPKEAYQFSGKLSTYEDPREKYKQLYRLEILNETVQYCSDLVMMLRTLSREDKNASKIFTGLKDTGMGADSVEKVYEELFKAKTEYYLQLWGYPPLHRIRLEEQIFYEIEVDKLHRKMVPIYTFFKRNYPLYTAYRHGLRVIPLKDQDGNHALVTPEPDGTFDIRVILDVDKWVQNTIQVAENIYWIFNNVFYPQIFPLAFLTGIKGQVKRKIGNLNIKPLQFAKPEPINLDVLREKLELEHVSNIKVITNENIEEFYRLLGKNGYQIRKENEGTRLKILNAQGRVVTALDFIYDGRIYGASRYLEKLDLYVILGDTKKAVAIELLTIKDWLYRPSFYNGIKAALQQILISWTVTPQSSEALYVGEDPKAFLSGLEDEQKAFSDKIFRLIQHYTVFSRLKELGSEFFDEKFIQFLLIKELRKLQLRDREGIPTLRIEALITGLTILCYKRLFPPTKEGLCDKLIDQNELIAKTVQTFATFFDGIYGKPLTRTKYNLFLAKLEHFVSESLT